MEGTARTERSRSPRSSASAVVPAPTAIRGPSTPTIVVWTTRFGAMGIVEERQGLVEVRVGEPAAESLRGALLTRYAGAKVCKGSAVADLLDRYCRGEVVSFNGIALVERPMGVFHRRVLEACRAIEYGRTISYGALAALAGRPAAARAVGTAMASNPWPIVVPCHRVVRSTGALGGYSAAAGLALKQALLDLEAQQWTLTRPTADER